MLEVTARSISDNIKSVDPELRVEICDRRDKVLERMIDIAPHEEYNHNTRNIYTPAVQGYRRWNNVELMKDKGLVGYTLAKEIGARSIMYFGTNPSNYPYLSELPEIKVLCSNHASGTAEDYYNHLNEFFSEMDVLILHGMYEETIGFLDAYRRLRPDGKVFCGLDMNSYWMNNTPWGNPMVHKFANQCDIIATSCRSIRDELNRNPMVNFSCRWFPNGFFNPTDTVICAKPEKKENIILTVGRIGTAEKNNQELLIAFARISNILTDWKVYLVGPVEPEFQSFIDLYFTERPELKKRVIFKGAISKKEELYKEYARAKIFVLTSPSEGGTPNVYAEALFHGCMFVTSSIDAADDIINFGQLGAKYHVGDVDALSSTLVEICSKANEYTIKKHIPKALRYAEKHYDWSRNAKKLAYMMFSE